MRTCYAKSISPFAGHRGSIFGQIGRDPGNQKKFDSLLIHELERLKTEPYVFIEGASRRIGKVSLPQFLYDKKENGKQIVIHLPIEEWIKIVLSNYEPWNNPECFKEAFQLIRKRLHTPIAKQIETHLENGEFELVVELLLEHYYDPRYKHSGNQNTDLQKVDIEAKNVEDAFQKVLQTIERDQLRLGVIASEF